MDARVIGEVIRTPFNWLGSILNFFMGNILIIIFLVVIGFILYKYWWAIGVVFLKIYDKFNRTERRLENVQEEKSRDTGNSTSTTTSPSESNN